MKISIFGLGRVGSVSAACLAEMGHQVIGVDINRDIVQMIRAGKSPIVEKGLKELIETQVQAGNLDATTDAYRAVLETEVSFVCVGTPSLPNGNVNGQYLEGLCGDLGAALRKKLAYHTIALRSTVLPGTTEDILVPILEQNSGKVAGRDFGVVYNPEFLREGNAVVDFYRPTRVVIGEGGCGNGETLTRVYARIDAAVVRTTMRIAEMVKYGDNAFHALKVTFANEIGNICQRLGIDSHRVMEIFCMDTKLNLSSAYLRPGYAFGGPCLPKDLRALIYRARSLDLATPLLQSVLTSNEYHKRLAFELIYRTGKQKVGVLGLSFKPGTDDLRESPVVELVDMLIDKGYQVWIYEPNLVSHRLTPSNKAFIDVSLPQIASLMCDSAREVISRAEVVVLASPDIIDSDSLLSLNENQILIDLHQSHDA